MTRDEILENLIEVVGQLDVIKDGLANIYGLDEEKMFKLLEACEELLTGIQKVIGSAIFHLMPDCLKSIPDDECECKVIPFPTKEDRNND